MYVSIGKNCKTVKQLLNDAATLLYDYNHIVTLITLRKNVRKIKKFSKQRSKKYKLTFRKNCLSNIQEKKAYIQKKQTNKYNKRHKNSIIILYSSYK